MQLWRWIGANDGCTPLLPVDDADFLNDVFMVDGTPKTWATRPQVKPGLESPPKKQLPLGDLSFLVGASIVLNDKAYGVLGDFLLRFGEFLDLNLVDPTGMAGGDQTLHLYNVTRLVSCIDVSRSQMNGKKVVTPAFLPAAIPDEVMIFKDPLRAKIDIYVTAAAHEELVRRMAEAGLRGSSLRRIV